MARGESEVNEVTGCGVKGEGGSLLKRGASGGEGGGRWKGLIPTFELLPRPPRPPWLSHCDGASGAAGTAQLPHVGQTPARKELRIWDPVFTAGSATPCQGTWSEGLQVSVLGQWAGLWASFQNVGKHGACAGAWTRAASGPGDCWATYPVEVGAPAPQLGWVTDTLVSNIPHGEAGTLLFPSVMLMALDSLQRRMLGKRKRGWEHRSLHSQCRHPLPFPPSVPPDRRGRGLHPGQAGTTAPRQGVAGGAEVRAGQPRPSKALLHTAE